jgi:hypothetical protein
MRRLLTKWVGWFAGDRTMQGADVARGPCRDWLARSGRHRRPRSIIIPRQRRSIGRTGAASSRAIASTCWEGLSSKRPRLTGAKSLAAPRHALQLMPCKDRKLANASSASGSTIPLRSPTKSMSGAPGQKRPAAHSTMRLFVPTPDPRSALGRQSLAAPVAVTSDLPPGATNFTPRPIESTYCQQTT